MDWKFLDPAWFRDSRQIQLREESQRNLRCIMHLAILMVNQGFQDGTLWLDAWRKSMQDAAAKLLRHWMAVMLNEWNDLIIFIFY